jgi:predicted GIY-YIG superfamily endonuclease
MDAKKLSCVYVLRDPRDMIVRYVGISMKPKVRMRQHLEWACGRTNFEYSKPGTEARYLWFNELLKEDLQPIMHVVFSGLTLEQARRVEGHLIKKTMKHNDGQLFQADSGRKSPLVDFDAMWRKCNVKERELIRNMVLSAEYAS